MIKLEAVDLEWITGTDDNPDDQCSHGKCIFQVNEKKFVGVSDGEWTLTLAALHLLRTLNDDHLPDDRVAMNYLIPCCGQDVYLTNKDVGTQKYGVYSIGCNLGIDVWIKHKDDLVEFTLDKKVTQATIQDWTKAVFSFVDQVMGFYEQYSNKSIIKDPHIRAGWAELWKEISIRRNVVP